MHEEDSILAFWAQNHDRGISCCCWGQFIHVPVLVRGTWEGISVVIFLSIARASCQTNTKTGTKKRMILNSLNKDIWSLVEMSRLHQLAIRDRGYFDILVSDRIHSTKLFEKR